MHTLATIDSRRTIRRGGCSGDSDSRASSGIPNRVVESLLADLPIQDFDIPNSISGWLPEDLRLAVLTPLNGSHGCIPGCPSIQNQPCHCRWRWRGERGDQNPSVRPDAEIARAISPKARNSVLAISRVASFTITSQMNDCGTTGRLWYWPSCTCISPQQSMTKRLHAPILLDRDGVIPLSAK